MLPAFLGVKGIYRTSATHALNLRATAHKYAKSVGRKYNEMNLIVCHIDGGITITAHQHGRMIDANDGSGGDGPMTPTRMGTMAITDVLTKLYDSRTKEELRSLCMATGGLSSWFGTSNSDTIHDLVEAGDALSKRATSFNLFNTLKNRLFHSSSLCSSSLMRSALFTLNMMKKTIENKIRQITRVNIRLEKSKLIHSEPDTG